MIFLDTWIWIEFFSRGKRRNKAKEVIEQLERIEAVISTAVLMEIRFIIRRKYDEEKANRIATIIEGCKNLYIIPLTPEVAIYAADLRDKYHGKKGKEFSHGDAIHLATAVLTGCEKLYSGDPDFEGIEELDTTIV